MSTLSRLFFTLVLFSLTGTFLPAQEDAKALQAATALLANDGNKALAIVTEVSEAGTLSPAWLELKALALHKTKNYEEAIDAFLELGKVAPLTLDTRAPELAECYLLSAQPAMAVPLFQKIQRTSEVNRLNAHLNLLLAGKSADVQAALTKMEDGLVKGLTQASLFYLQDKKDEAKAATLAAIKDQPEDVTKMYLHTMRELGWAKDLEAKPATATTSAPAPAASSTAPEVSSTPAR